MIETQSAIRAVLCQERAQSAGRSWFKAPSLSLQPRATVQQGKEVGEYRPRHMQMTSKDELGGGWSVTWDMSAANRSG